MKILKIIMLILFCFMCFGVYNLRDDTEREEKKSYRTQSVDNTILKSTGHDHKFTVHSNFLRGTRHCNRTIFII